MARDPLFPPKLGPGSFEREAELAEEQRLVVRHGDELPPEDDDDALDDYERQMALERMRVSRDCCGND